MRGSFKEEDYMIRPKKKMWQIALPLIFAAIIFIVFFKEWDKWMEGPDGFGKSNQNALEVSVINLIADPEKFDGKLVRVIGASKLGLESNALYLSGDDYINSNTKNAIWLSTEALSEDLTTLKNLNGKYAVIEGVFNSHNNGHFYRYSGSIENISRFEKWN